MNKQSLRVSGNDLFFAFQVVMAYFFALPQVFKMFESVQGVTINWLLCADLFVILNLYLMVGVHKKSRSRQSLQTLLIYANWVVLVTPMVIITFFRCAWGRQDTLVASLIAGAAIIVFSWGHFSGRGLIDPVIRGLLVGLFRVVPHLYLSYCIIQAGSGSGIATKTVVAANITATARIITLYLAGRKTGWDKGLVASILSEIGNEASWMIVTLIWLVR